MTWELKPLVLAASSGLGLLLLFKAWLKHGTKQNITNSVDVKSWGICKEGEVHLWTLKSGEMEVDISSLGCQLVACRVPTPGGLRDVCMGYDSLTDCVNGKQNFGTVVGRYANRVKGGRFCLEGRAAPVQLECNNGPNHLHGGTGGFYQRNFSKMSARATTEGVEVSLYRRSEDGEEGYPGVLDVTVTYRLEGNELSMRFEAEAIGQPTICSLTHHGYWNLRGHQSGDVRGTHELWLPNCDAYTEVDESMAATGRHVPVEGTDFDFRAGYVPLGSRRYQEGYDLDLRVDRKNAQNTNGLVTVAHLKADGLSMTVLSDQPGLQVYSGGGINPENAQWQVPGKGGVRYARFGAICLEAQNHPDAVNQPSFPSPVLYPGTTYVNRAVHRFSCD